MTAPAGPGWVVTNPPYGVRVGDTRKLRDLYARTGDVLRERFAGWRLGILLAHGPNKRALRLDLPSWGATTNGGLKVEMVTGRIPSRA